MSYSCWIFVVTSIVAVCFGQTPSPFDKFVDEIIWEAEQKMINESKTSLDLQDIDLAFDKKILIWDLKGDIKTSGGRISNLATIKRIGDINVDSSNDVIITATFGMSDLSIHFDEIHLDFLSIHIEDGIDLKISKNAVNMNVSLHYDGSGNCSVILNKADIASLGSFHTTLLPDNFIHKMTDWIVTATLDVFSSVIKNAINSHLTEQLNAVVQGMDLCNKLPF